MKFDNSRRVLAVVQEKKHQISASAKSLDGAELRAAVALSSVRLRGGKQVV